MVFEKELHSHGNPHVAGEHAFLRTVELVDALLARLVEAHVPQFHLDPQQAPAGSDEEPALLSGASSKPMATSVVRSGAGARRRHHHRCEAGRRRRHRQNHDRRRRPAWDALH